MKTAHEFLQNFCFANTHNQSLLFEKLDLTHYPSNEWEATTATYIFKVFTFSEILIFLNFKVVFLKDNPTLCNEINERYS